LNIVLVITIRVAKLAIHVSHNSELPESSEPVQGTTKIDPELLRILLADSRGITRLFAQGKMAKALQFI